MASSPGDRPVLVAVGDPAHAQQLVRTAGDLALQGSRTVRLVTVVDKPYDSPFGVFDDETIRQQFASDSQELLELATTPPDVVVERDLVVARSVSRGVLRTVEETDPAALVVGWQAPTRRSDVVLGTTVDALLERAACDLYVERVGREADGVDSVLLPVAGGPHVGVAARAATAIAARNEARVVVLTVATESGDLAPSTFLADGRESVSAVDPTVGVETVVAEGPDPTSVIADAAADHDVVVLGATRKGALRRRLVGSVARRVVDLTDTTVILARDGQTVGGPVAWLGGLLRR
ncbi:universal stress protein [Halobacteriales archaeon Cl-PHB]